MQMTHVFDVIKVLSPVREGTVRMVHKKGGEQLLDGAPRMDLEVQIEFIRRLLEQLDLGNGPAIAQAGKDYQQRRQNAWVDAERAAQNAIDAGHSMQHAEAVYEFAYDCGISEAVNLLPRWPMTRVQFDALPIHDLDNSPNGRRVPYPSGWFRVQMIRGVWVLVGSSDGIGGYFFKPQLEGVSLYH